MKKLIAIIGIGVCMSGCMMRQIIWSKDGATAQEYNKDAYECRHDAMMLPTGYGGQIYDIVKRNQMFNQCMEARG